MSGIQEAHLLTTCTYRWPGSGSSVQAAVFCGGGSLSWEVVCVGGKGGTAWEDSNYSRFQAACAAPRAAPEPSLSGR